MQTEQIKMIQQKLSTLAQPESLQERINHSLDQITHWAFSHMGWDEDIVPYVPELYGLKRKRKKKICESFVALDQSDVYHSHGYIQDKLSIIFEPLSAEYRKDVLCYEYDGVHTDRLTIEYGDYHFKDNQLHFNENAITTLKAIRRSYWQDSSTLVTISVGLFSAPKSHIFCFLGGKLKEVKIIIYDNALSVVNELSYEVNDDQDYDDLFPKSDCGLEDERALFSVLFQNLTEKQRVEINQAVSDGQYAVIECLVKSNIRNLHYDDQLVLMDVLRGLLDKEDERYLNMLKEGHGVSVNDVESLNAFIVQLIDYVQDVLEED